MNEFGAQNINIFFLQNKIIDINEMHLSMKKKISFLNAFQYMIHAFTKTIETNPMCLLMFIMINNKINGFAFTRHGDNSCI